MKYRWDKKYLYWGITIFLVICSCICFYYLLFHGSNFKNSLQKIIQISMPILNGLGLAYLMAPLLNAIEFKIIKPLYKKFDVVITPGANKRIRGYCIILTLIVVFCLLYSFFSLVIPQLVTSIQSIIYQFPLYIDNLLAWISQVLSDNPDIEMFVMNNISNYSSEFQGFLNQVVLPQANELIKTLSNGVFGFFLALWNLIIGLILSIYILASKERFSAQAKKLIYAMFEAQTANTFISNVRFSHRTFSGFLGGKIVDSIIIGIICFVITNMMGTPYAVLVSVIIGITNVIPFFGPYLGAIPSAILILMVNPLQCLYFIIFILFLQQFDGNVLGPKILGDSTGLTSFWVIFSITIFGGLFGIFGMFIGVPTFAVIYAAIKSFVNRSLVKKGYTDDTEKYLLLSSIENKEFVNLSISNNAKKNLFTGKMTRQKNTSEQEHSEASAQKKDSFIWNDRKNQTLSEEDPTSNDKDEK